MKIGITTPLMLKPSWWLFVICLLIYALGLALFIFALHIDYDPWTTT